MKSDEAAAAGAAHAEALHARYTIALDMHCEMRQHAEQEQEMSLLRATQLQAELRDLQEAVEISQERAAMQSADASAGSRAQQLEVELSSARLIAANAEEDNQQLQQEVRSLQQAQDNLNGRLNSCLRAIDLLEASKAALQDNLQGSETTLEDLMQQLREREMVADMAQEMQQLQLADLSAAEQVISRLTASSAGATIYQEHASGQVPGSGAGACCRQASS